MDEGVPVYVRKNKRKCVPKGCITSSRSIIVLCGTDNSLQNILDIQNECVEYFS